MGLVDRAGGAGGAADVADLGEFGGVLGAVQRERRVGAELVRRREAETRRPEQRVIELRQPVDDFSLRRGCHRHYLLEQEIAGPEGQFAMVKKCMDNWKKLRA